MVFKFSFGPKAATAAAKSGVTTTTSITNNNTVGPVAKAHPVASAGNLLSFSGNFHPAAGPLPHPAAGPLPHPIAGPSPHPAAGPLLHPAAGPHPTASSIQQNLSLNQKNQQQNSRQQLGNIFDNHNDDDNVNSDKESDQSDETPSSQMDPRDPRVLLQKRNLKSGSSAQQLKSSEFKKSDYRPPDVSENAISSSTKSMEDDNKNDNFMNGLAKKHTSGLDELINQNPSVFGYDEFIDDKKDKGYAYKETTDVEEQLKREGMYIPDKNFKQKMLERKAQYVDGMQQIRQERELEKDLIDQKKLDREMEAEGKDAEDEVFVTGAYAAELKKRKEFEKILLQKDKDDNSEFTNTGENGQHFGMAMAQKFLNEKVNKSGSSESGPVSGTEPGTETVKPTTKRIFGPARPVDPNSTSNDSDNINSTGTSVTLSSVTNQKRPNDAEDQIQNQIQNQNQNQKRQKIDNIKKDKIVDETEISMTPEELSASNLAKEKAIAQRKLEEAVQLERAKQEAIAKMEKEKKEKEEMEVKRKELQKRAGTAKERYLARKKEEAEAKAASAKNTSSEN